MKPSRIVESEQESPWPAIALIVAAVLLSGMCWFVVFLYVLYGGHG